MKPSKLMTLAIAGLLVASLIKTTWAAPPKMKMTTPIPPEITTPDKVETSIGTLKFIDGAPLPETAKKAYDYLDTSRAVDVFFKGIAPSSLLGIIEGAHELGAVQAHEVMLFDKLMDSKSLYLTANTSTMYAFPTLDLERDGATVLEAPAGVLGAFNDAWFRYVQDIGPAGPDKAKGGKYLVLPPGYNGDIPDGYFVVKSKSYKVWVFMRVSVDKGLEAAANHIRDNLKVYPLSKKDNPPELRLISASGKSFNTIHPNDFSFYAHLNKVIQKEPLEVIDPETRGLLASIGIEKGKPYNPDRRMKKILTDAVAIGNAAVRSTVWHPRVDGTMEGVEVYPGKNSSWIMAFLGKNVFFNGENGQTMNSDARVNFYYPYTAVTPAMAVTNEGVGSDYAISFVDSQKMPMDGGKTYKIHIPANPPAKDFWAFTTYDTQTRSMLQTDQQFPTLGSQSKGVKKNKDGSCDVYFSPKPPEGYENNWLQTIPGKSWFVILRMYGPLKPWIDKTWRPGEIEMVK